MSFFSALLEALQSASSLLYWLSPLKWVVARRGEAAVRFTFGKPGKVLGAGLHFATTGQELEREQVRLRKNCIDEIEFPLADNVPVKVNAAFLFDIQDLPSFLTNSEDTYWIVSEFAEAEVRKALSDMTYDDLIGGLTEVEWVIKNALQNTLGRYSLGVGLRTFRITGMTVEAEVMRSALCVPRLVKAMGQVPPALSEGRNFGALVALVTPTFPTNVINEPLEEDAEDQ